MLYITGQDYKISYNTAATRKEGRIGSCNYAYSEITIDPSFSADVQKIAMLHEILEALNTQHEYDLAHNIIASLSTCLYQVMKDNPETFTFYLPEEDYVS